MSFIVGAAIGFAVGVFCPAVARKVKALFVKKSQDALKQNLPKV